MPTELMRRTAIAYFDQMGMTYTVVAEETIRITIRSSYGDVHIEVAHFKDLSFLVITVRDFVSFPDPRAAEAMTLCNECNIRIVEKFHMAPDNHITFVYEWVATEISGPDEFHAMLLTVLPNFKGAYRTFMAVRWAKLTIGEAKKMLKGGEHRDDGNDDDEDDTPPLGDKLDNELKQLLDVADSDSPEADDTDKGADEDDSSEDDAPKD